MQPDFKTIADFRRDNAKAFQAVFRQFHLLCRDLELFGGELVAIDGTKLKAVNNVAQVCSAEKLRARIERIDARLAEFLAALEAGDRAEPAAEAFHRPLRCVKKVIQFWRFGVELHMVKSLGDHQPL